MTYRNFISPVVALLLVAQVSFAADPPADTQSISVGAEIYTNPKPGPYPKITYPKAELDSGEEGWVFVQMMIDPNGKPYELEVCGSTGNKEFEKRALESVATMDFQPATLGGKPIDAAVVLPVYFTIQGYNGVTPAFSTAYTSLVKSITAKDEAAARAGLGRLKPKNLYENAAYGMARFVFAKEWGTNEEQLEGLRIAVAGRTEPKYLSKEIFTYALRSLFLGLVKAHDYSSALSVWKTLQPLDKDQKIAEQLGGVVKQIEQLRADPRPFTVTGKLPNGTWSHSLFRNKFFIRVLSGRVSQIKLYCEKRYVLFSFDPELEYKVEDKFGQCSIVVLGDGETNIELVQKT